MGQHFVRFALVGIVLAAPPIIAQENTPASPSASQVVVTGRVTSQAGAPLAGVQVFWAGRGTGTQTASDGRYTLVFQPTSDSQRTLSARVLGYLPQSAAITFQSGDSIRHDFVLLPNPLRLGEVIVTGAGTSTTRDKLATAVTTIDSSRLRLASSPQNLVSAMAGLIPNADIRTHSGEPGASASIRIRGASTLLGVSEPLFVIDGQPISNLTEATTPHGGPEASLGGTVTPNRVADINPNDIESIEVLPSSVASAIYGARAAHGVVLITTKRGFAGPTRFSVSSTNAWDNVKPAIALQREFGQGLFGLAPAPCSVYVPPGESFPVGMSPCRQRSWGPLLPAGTPTYDHLSEIYRTGFTSDNYLSVSGGNERTTIYLAGGFVAQRGVLVSPNNKYNRANFRMKAAHSLSDAIRLEGNFTYTDARGRYVQKGSNTSGLLLGALRTPPDFNNQPYLDPATGLHRSYRYSEPEPGSDRLTRLYDNPFFVLANSGNRSELGRSIANLNTNWIPRSWLTVKHTLGVDYYNDWRLETLPLSSSDNPDGSVIRNDFTNFEVDHNLIATASHTFTPQLDGRLTVGQNLNSRRFRGMYVGGFGLNAPAPYAIQNTVDMLATEYRSLVHSESYFGQIEADIIDQVFLTLGVRNDGFSTFGPDHRRAWYPKANAAWIFRDARDGASRGILDFGRFRIAYGETGQEPPVYASITALNSEIVFGSGLGDVLTINQDGFGGLATDWMIGNADLKPERQRETEVGVDLALFDQRLDLGVTYYNKQSRDMIVLMPAHAAETGGSQRYANAASLSNKGLELTINSRLYESSTSSVELGGTFGKNTGKVLDLGGPEYIPYVTEGFSDAYGSSTVGYAPGVIRGLDFVRCGRGVMADGIDIDAYCQSQNAPDGALYLAADGWPLYDFTDRVIADPNPKYTMSFNSSVRFLSNFRFSALVDVRKGGQVWNGTLGQLYNFGTHADTRIRTRTAQLGRDYYTHLYPNVTGPGADVPSFASEADWQAWFLSIGGTNGPQQQFIEDGSFVKLREISLSYTTAHPFIRSLTGFSDATVRVAGRNLMTWTRYKGLDPETSFQGAQSVTLGMDYFGSPQTRSFVVSISLNR